MDRLNAWLSLIANFGVIIGLVAVVIEIRQNTDIARMEAYRENTLEISRWRSELAADPGLVEVFDQYWYQGRIAEADQTGRTRIGMMINNLFTAYENAYLAYRFEIIEEDEWLRFLPAACMHLDTAERNGSNLHLQFVKADFRAYLRTTCDQLPAELKIQQP